MKGELAGGLYGVAIGGAFFGESMFSRQANASKVALAYLCDYLLQRGFSLLDTQWTTPHLRRLGAIDIPKARYMEVLRRAIGSKMSFV